jgi:preprotein translocase subunit SecF
MNKRHLHHLWRRFRVLKPWYFLVIAAIAGIICVFAMRNNYEHMVQLRNDLYTADKDNGDVAKALNNLRNYVYGHMNTNLSSGNTSVYPPIQLKYTYDRLVQAQGQDAASQNSQIYTQAQAYCEQQNSTDFSGRNRVPCIEDYVSKHTTSATANIPDSLYKFNFVSPTWSPDLAGWSMAIAVLSTFTAGFLFVIQRWFKHLVND